MAPQLEIILIAIFVSVACTIPGVFLVLRGVALMSDAISHAILLGIVVFFFLVHDLDSPLLLIGASLSGVLTVSLTEILIKTNRMKKDAAIGLVFPIFFSIGVILISRFASRIHLDVDAVLLGELAFAPFNRYEFFGMDFGPKAMLTMGIILVLNFFFLIFFYKELKISTFDPGLSLSLGISPALLHYSLMLVTSITAVSAFDAVGSILVVALMITPPSTAYLLTRSLGKMIAVSMVIGGLSAMGGYMMAAILDVSIAGAMVSVSGLLFLLALFFSVEKGLLPKFLLAKRQKLSFSMQLLMVQLLSHEGTPKEKDENTISNMVQHMEWSFTFANRVTKYSVQKRMLERNGNFLSLTALGREKAKQVMTDY